MNEERRPRTSFSPGTILDGRYEIVSRIGAGGMGEVFRARHLQSNAPRCIKTVKPALVQNETFLARFLREARIATKIEHPNIARVHELVYGEHGPYLVAEFIEGKTIRQWSVERGAFSVALSCNVALQVLAGLEHLHGLGLVHRDIAPGNVMLARGADGRAIVKIIDLGIAKETTADAEMTQSGVLIGNPQYMSPEQLGTLAEGEQLDGRSDLYSLGLLLYEMLAGTPAFTSETQHGFVARHLTQMPPRFAQVRPGLGVPQQLEHVVLRALEKDRRRRYADARAMKAALAPFLNASASSTADRKQREDAEARAFDDAWEAGTTEAWDRYLHDHPDSKRLDDARRCREEGADFAQSATSNDIEVWRAFLKRWPEGRHRLDAALRKQALGKPK